ncbi:TPA: hypothetical protein ACNU2W_002101 [Aeromonas salmonicida subsp. pectinolytica]
MNELAEILSKLPHADLARMLAERMQADNSSPATQSRHDLGGGISLYKQKYSSKWYCRIHQPEIMIIDYRQSTRKVNLQEARSEAFQIAAMLKLKASSGIPLKKGITLKTIANDVIAYYTNRAKTNDKYCVSIINNHILPYFGGMEIAKINDRTIRLFWIKYCQEQGTPSKTFVVTMNVVLRKILLEAKEQGLITVLPDLNKKVDTRKQIKGEFWEADEITIIFEKLKKWHANTPRLQDRYFLTLYCKLLLLTGIRTGEEALNITWGDIIRRNDMGKVDYYCIIRKGKMENTRKAKREVLIAKGGESSKVITDVLSPLASSLGFESLKDAMENAQDMPLFKFEDPAKLWRDFTKHMGLKGNLYWFRHTYITNEIISGKPLAHIAAQVGNSVKVIEEHYAHATMRLVRTAELKGHGA